MRARLFRHGSNSSGANIMTHYVIYVFQMAGLTGTSFPTPNCLFRSVSQVARRVLGAIESRTYAATQRLDKSGLNGSEPLNRGYQPHLFLHAIRAFLRLHPLHVLFVGTPVAGPFSYMLLSVCASARRWRHTRHKEDTCA